MKEEISKLVTISRNIGALADFVQGGGGNTSVKIDSNCMAIKASGYALKNMTEDSGFTFVKYNNISSYIKNNNIVNDTENEFSEFITSNIIEKDGYPYLKPSIETGFHAIIPYKYVIHTHSVYANILCCSCSGEKILKMLFPSGIWVEYANPGKDITIKLAKVLKGNKYNVIFMQNHGIIVCSNSSDEAEKIHTEVNLKIKDYFNIGNDYKMQKNIIDISELKRRVIFPDQVVYLLSKDLENTTAGVETIYAYYYIMDKINKLGFSPTFISKEDIKYIENMESEKYRKSIIEK